MTIGEALKELRQSMHYTQAQMVEGTYLSVSHYSKIENGYQEIKAIDLFDLLDKRQIDVNRFKAKISGDRQDDMAILSDKLVKAFYKPDIEELKKIKNEIDKYHDAEELQIRAEIAVAGLTNQIDGVKAQLNERIMKFLLSDRHWSHDQKMLSLIGNSIWVININSLNLIMTKILNEYKDIKKYSLDVQKRIASIYINYLHVLFNYKKHDLAKKYINELLKLSSVPELTLFKMLTLYYQALFADDEVRAKEIISPLKCVVPKIIKYLPVK